MGALSARALPMLMSSMSSALRAALIWPLAVARARERGLRRRSAGLVAARRMSSTNWASTNSRCMPDSVPQKRRRGKMPHVSKCGWMQRLLVFGVLLTAVVACSAPPGRACAAGGRRVRGRRRGDPALRRRPLRSVRRCVPRRGGRGRLAAAAGRRHRRPCRVQLVSRRHGVQGRAGRLPRRRQVLAGQVPGAAAEARGLQLEVDRHERALLQRRPRHDQLELELRRVRHQVQREQRRELLAASAAGTSAAAASRAPAAGRGAARPRSRRPRARRATARATATERSAR